MCIIKKPKVAAAPAPKDPPVLRNPYLDGVDALIRSRSTGLRSLRIDRAGVQAPKTNPTPASLTAPAASQQGGSVMSAAAERILTGLGIQR
jgi:hypothetical protein